MSVLGEVRAYRGKCLIAQAPNHDMDGYVVDHYIARVKGNANLHETDFAMSNCGAQIIARSSSFRKILFKADESALASLPLLYLSTISTVYRRKK
jgi:hypothetical protein